MIWVIFKLEKNGFIIDVLILYDLFLWYISSIIILFNSLLLNKFYFIFGKIIY